MFCRFSLIAVLVAPSFCFGQASPLTNSELVELTSCSSLQFEDSVANIHKNFNCINLLTKQNFWLAEQVNALSSRALGVPKDAVLAFDRPGRCPEGWAEFVEAQSRMLLGATFGKPDVLNPDSDLSQTKYRQHGGEESVTLTLEQIPQHSHSYSSTANGDFWDNPHNINPARKRFGEIGEKTTSTAGSGHAHNNMPPFVALYFCKKN